MMPMENITQQKRKEATLRFIVDLNTATQRLTDPDEIMAATAKMLGEYLNVDRCAYAEVENESLFVITGDYPRDVPSIVGRWPVAGFGPECSRMMLNNQPYVVSDAENDPRIRPENLPSYHATNIRAVICVPLHKAGKFTAAMAVHQKTLRHWTHEELRQWLVNTQTRNEAAKQSHARRRAKEAAAQLQSLKKAA